LITIPVISVLAPTDPADFEQRHYAVFVDLLRSHTKVPVQIIPDMGADFPSNGVIILNGYGRRVLEHGNDDLVEFLLSFWTESERKRIFCLNSDRGNEALRIANELKLAGSVDHQDYRVGIDPLLLGKGPYNDSGLTGLTSAVDKLGCYVDNEKGIYSKILCPPFPNIAALIAAYLEAYWPLVVETRNLR